MEEYFRAKRNLLMDGNAYGDMIAAYPAYWSGLNWLELVILMDAWVLGRIWMGQIMGRNLQIEAWAANTAPDVMALQKLLSAIDNQRAVWSQVRAFRWDRSRGQRGEESIRRDPTRATEAGGEEDRTRRWAPTGLWQYPTHPGHHCHQERRRRAAQTGGG